MSKIVGVLWFKALQVPKIKTSKICAFVLSFGDNLNKELTKYWIIVVTYPVFLAILLKVSALNIREPADFHVHPIIVT